MTQAFLKNITITNYSEGIIKKKLLSTCTGINFIKMSKLLEQWLSSFYGTLSPLIMMLYVPHPSCQSPQNTFGFVWMTTPLLKVGRKNVLPFPCPHLPSSPSRQMKWKNKKLLLLTKATERSYKF